MVRAQFRRHRMRLAGIAAVAVVFASAPTVHAQTCQPQWAVGFGPIPAPAAVGAIGLNSIGSTTVNALAVFDDGAGPSLYAGGFFSSAGGVPTSNIARWDGASWTPLGNGLNNTVHALAVFDDGTGPALYAGGFFTSAGGVPASRIAKWDGASWTPLGSGVGGFSGSTVVALAVFDDGAGPALYAGGLFSSAGGVAASRIAKWDGAVWMPLGSGPNDRVDALTVFDDGSGPALYAGGLFSSAGGVMVNRIAKWDGAAWTPLGTGVGGAFGSGTVNALTVFDDGSGPALYAGGSFSFAGGVTANRIARWDGATWSVQTGLGVDDSVETLSPLSIQGTSELYATGVFSFQGKEASKGVARFDGAAWGPLGGGVDNGAVNDLVVFNDMAGEAVYAGGSFTSIGGVPANFIATWDGAAWSPLGSGLNAAVNALAVFDDCVGPALYAACDFFSAGGLPVNRIARWDGQTWTPLGELGGGVGGAVVNDLAVFDDGTGPALFAGGGFSAAGSVSASHMAKWDGSTWSPLGSGINGHVRAMTIFDDGSGPALFAGGQFATAGGSPAHNIARWNGCDCSTPADLNGDGVVNGADLATLLANWGVAP